MATIQELETFKMSDAIKFHDELNPNLWNNDKLDPEVRKQLLLIAEDFITTLGIKDLAVKDITVSGSNAAYTYTPHSDLDLHVLVDFNELPNNEVYQELFNAKKIIYNDSHNITVHGVPVELYVQDTNLLVVSLGEYSVLNDKWIRIPKKQKANLDQEATRAKFDKLAELVELALQTRDPNRVAKTLDTIKRYRKAGLAKGGEFSPENLAFKAIRKQGGIQDLYDLKNELHSEKLSIEEAASREDAILKIKKLRNLKGRTPNEVENVNRIVANLMKQWNIQPVEIGIKEPVDPLKAKIAKAAYEKNTAANMFKQEWERFKKGIFAEQETDEDYDPNGPPPGPEFKPTMPAGTVKVDVSDVYDWYKLGQHISNLHGLGKHDFGKGPPSTIMAFGDEDTEHQYIQDLEKTGLTTTDIDPVDPNQPKGMKRQKTDPTYNVNETDDRTAAVLKIQKHLNKKYGANLDLDGKLGPLTLKSINKFMPRAKKGLADEPNKTTAVQGNKLKESSGAKIDAHREGDTIWINYFEVPVKGKGLGRAEYEKFEKSLPKDIKKIRLVASDAGYGPTHDFWDRMGFDYAYPDDDNEMVKLLEAPRTFQSQVTPLEKLIQDYGYFTSFGTVHLDKQATTPDGQQQLLSLVQRLQKDSKSFNGLDKQKIEANRDTILNHIYQMMQYAIPILKKHLPADAWEAKRGQINSVLTAYNNARQIDEASDYSQHESEIEDFVQSLNPDDVGVEQIGPYHVHFEGFTDECQEHAQERCNLPPSDPRHLATYDDVYKEVIGDFVRREGGKKPIKVGFSGYEDYPVIYAVFHNPEPYKNPDAWNPFNVNEASGYIPSAKEKNDPRFKTALTVDVKPDANKKNAKAFGWKVSRAGIPPQARADGKIK